MSTQTSINTQRIVYEFYHFYQKFIMERTQSQRAKEHIMTDGYRYRKDRANADGSASWRCFKRDCKGRMKVTIAVIRPVSSLWTCLCAQLSAHNCPTRN